MNNMRNINLNCRAEMPPCKGCEERSLGCHGKCERYKIWKKELDEKNQKVLKARHDAYELDRYCKAQAHKIYERKRKKSGKMKLGR